MIYKSDAAFKEEVFSTFCPVTVSALVDALAKGYVTSQEHHEPERGSNGTTFGTDVYNHTIHELQKAAKASEGRMDVISVRPFFRLKVGNFEVANHKVGKHESDSILNSFPRTGTAARSPRKVTLESRQIAFDFYHSKDLEVPIKPLVDLEALEVPFNLVLAHMGNPEQGLCAVYLCRPGEPVKKQIKNWEFTHLLWKKTEVAPALPPEPFDLPAAEDSPMPKVRRKKKAN